MNTKKVLPLVAAVVLGLIAARLVVKLAANHQGMMTLTMPKLPKVVVVKQAVGAGQELTTDDLVTGQLAVESAPGLTFSDPAEVVGRVTLTPLVAGQAVMETLLAPKGSGSGLQALIPAGMRALTVEINEISGVAGYLNVGSHVDVLQTLRDDATTSSLSRAIAQNIEVTAVGQRHVGPDDAGQPVRSVTLLVTPHQAAVIELASMSGRPRLVLRGSSDRVIEETDPVTTAELLGHPKGYKPQLASDTSTTRPAQVMAVSDPFAPTTRPSGQEWVIQMITGGEPSTVSIKLPPAEIKTPQTPATPLPVNTTPSNTAAGNTVTQTDLGH